MMKRSILIIFILLGIVYTAPTVKVTVDRDKINEGDSITLTVTAEGSEDLPEVDISSVSRDFKIVSGPNQSVNMQWINGKLSSTNALSWMLIPKKKGSLVIPQFPITVDGKKYQSNLINITVYEGGSSDQTSNQNGSVPVNNFFIEATLDKNEVFRGEQITVTYTLYTSVDLTGYETTELPNFKGFWKTDLYSPRSLQMRDVQRSGKRYRAATVSKVALFPTKSGDITIDPLTALVSVQVKDRNLNWSFFSRSKSYTVASNSVSLSVKPLPENKAGRSASVGNWRLTTAISSTDVQQDDAVTLTIEIIGSGNLRSVNVSDIEFPPELEVFDPEISLDENPVRDKISGKKTIQYVLIPREAKEIVIPPVKLIFFDPNKGEWQTRSSKPIKLNVSPSDRIFSTTQGLTKEEIKIMGKDIRFADQEAPVWQRRYSGLISRLAVTFMSGSFIFFLLPGILSFGQTRIHATADVRTARKALKSAMGCLPSSSSDQLAVYAAISESVNKYVSLKLNREAERGSEEILEILASRKIDDTVISKISQLLQRGEAVRFAPVSTADAQRDLNQYVELMKEVDYVWK